jgi:hypothetical protein
MKRVLLISKDPLFAWALDKKLSSTDFHLEHVYTIPEAELRLKRFRYSAVFFDGISQHEIDTVRQSIDAPITFFLFSDSSVTEVADVSDVICIPKETALIETLSSLQRLSTI